MGFPNYTEYPTIHTIFLRVYAYYYYFTKQIVNDCKTKTMKTKSIVFLAIFSLLLLLGSCSKETRDAVDCLRNPEDCYLDEENALELQSAIEVDSISAVSTLPVKD